VFIQHSPLQNSAQHNGEIQMKLTLTMDEALVLSVALDQYIDISDPPESDDDPVIARCAAAQRVLDTVDQMIADAAANQRNPNGDNDA
jgi:hypothetical protein